MKVHKVHDYLNHIIKKQDKLFMRKGYMKYFIDTIT